MQKKAGVCISILLFLLFATATPMAGEKEACLDCHEGDDFPPRFLEFNNTGFPGGEETSEDVKEIHLEKFENSAHKDQLCTDCHTTATVDHDDEGKKIARVNCQSCHKGQYKTYSKTVHGKALLKRQDRFAPTCASCHGNHYILKASSPDSSTNILHVPETCGRCHKEGTAMTDTHEISRSKIVEHYSMSIHGKALFERGLTVAPVCTTCHGSHDILAHEDQKSKISKTNVAATCMQCHGLIEKTHQPMVRGRLWEKEQGKPPVCVECHKPHDLQQAIYDKTITDQNCLECHSNPDLKVTRDGKTVSLFVDNTKHENSVHKEEPCVKCHFDIHPDSDTLCKDPAALREHLQKTGNVVESVCKELKQVDCASCHDQEVLAYQTGIHGKLAAKNDADAPNCLTCHGKHDVLSKKDPASVTAALNIPNLCTDCHRDGEKSAIRKTATQTHILQSYSQSIHGEGAQKSGLSVSANCASCHTSHKVLPAADPESTVNHANISGTCSNCHIGISETLNKSVHSPEVTKTDKKLPVCNDCHSSHTISRHDAGEFRLQIATQCGDCHKDAMDSYFETYHGKASKLGEKNTAKCSDCHSSHNVLPATNAKSTLHPKNVVGTCKNCHPGSNPNFAGFLPHATHNDPVKYPILFYSYWAMTLLLIGTFLFFGLHTLLWLIRGLIDRKKHDQQF